MLVISQHILIEVLKQSNNITDSRTFLAGLHNNPNENTLTMLYQLCL